MLSRYVSTFFFFFFSSRRRHTRCSRDWSSDVCSSDLTDVFISTAAVADFRPARAAEHKIKKTGETMELAMQRTTDVLATVAARADRPFVVGFAAETEAVEQNARTKLMKKNLDMIAANEVGHDKAFDCDDNQLIVF